MPRPVDNSDRGEGVADVPQIDGARDESTAAWFAFRDEWTPKLRGYFRRLPCTRAQRDELVMDVLVDAFAAAHEGARGTTVREMIRALARQASAQFQRLVRHEVQLEKGDALAADDVREAVGAEPSACGRGSSRYSNAFPMPSGLRSSGVSTAYPML